MNDLNKFIDFEKQRLGENKDICDFGVGDTVQVKVKIGDGTDRTHTAEYLCIAKRSRGLGSSFRGRRVSNGVGIERVFLFYSPMLVSVSIVKKGVVRRAKLYYLRDRKGKSSRIKQDLSYGRFASKTQRVKSA